METTTIEVKMDVYERLVEKKEEENESFNDVLRRLLKMDSIIPEPFIPHYYEGIIEIPRLNLAGMDHIIDPIINHPYFDGSLQDRLKINGIDAEVEVEQTLKITVEAETEKEVVEKMKAVVKEDQLPELNRKLIEYHTRGLMQIDCKTGKRLDRAHSVVSGKYYGAPVSLAEAVDPKKKQEEGD